MSGTDLLDTLAGLRPGSRIASLRAERADIARHTQGAYEALMRPADPGGLPLSERAAVAAIVAHLNEDAALGAYYDGRLAEHGLPAGPRWDTISAHVAMVARSPRDGSPDALARLRVVGLSERDIVTLSQIVAFVSYQTRVLSGLELMESLDG